MNPKVSKARTQLLSRVWKTASPKSITSQTHSKIKATRLRAFVEIRFGGRATICFLRKQLKSAAAPPSPRYY